MARVQVLPLGPETLGDVTVVPFVLIIDGEGVEALSLSPLALDLFKEEIGARGIIVLSDGHTLDVASGITLTPEQRQTLLDTLPPTP